MGAYTRAVSGQRLGKHVPVAREQILNNATVGLHNGRAVFSMWSVPRGYRRDEVWNLVDSFVREYVKRGLEAEEQPMLEPLLGNV
jgi:hypothetical protein